LYKVSQLVWEKRGKWLFRRFGSIGGKGKKGKKKRKNTRHVVLASHNGNFASFAKHHALANYVRSYIWKKEQDGLFRQMMARVEHGPDCNCENRSYEWTFFDRKGIRMVGKIGLGNISFIRIAQGGVSVIVDLAEISNLRCLDCGSFTRQSRDQCSLTREMIVICFRQDATPWYQIACNSSQIK